MREDGGADVPCNLEDRVGLRARLRAATGSGMCCAVNQTQPTGRTMCDRLGGGIRAGFRHRAGPAVPGCAQAAESGWRRGWSGVPCNRRAGPPGWSCVPCNCRAGPPGPAVPGRGSPGSRVRQPAQLRAWCCVGQSAGGCPGCVRGLTPAGGADRALAGPMPAQQAPSGVPVLVRSRPYNARRPPQRRWAQAAQASLRLGAA